MSYDVALFFSRHPFPMESWRQVLAGFNPQEQEVSESARSRNVLAEWVAVSEDSSLLLELRDVRLSLNPKPPETQWQVFITRSRHRPRDAWLQFAVPYYALTLIEEAVFYDLQHNVFIADEGRYLEFVRPELNRFGVSKMFKLGLLDAFGTPVF